MILESTGFISFILSMDDIDKLVENYKNVQRKKNCRKLYFVIYEDSVQKVMHQSTKR
jgi:hypothetical protein